MKNGKYIYCFIDGKVINPPQLRGIGNHGNVYFINYKDLTIALSDTPYIAYSPSRENAMVHEKIIQSLTKEYDLVPCSFGNVFKSTDDIMTFMGKAYSYIKENLEKVKGKMEVGLRVFWKKALFSEEVETKEIKAVRDSLMQKPETQNYYSKMELGKMVEAQVDKRRQHYIDNIYRPIARHAVESVLNDPSNPLMVFNAAFLIWKSKEQEFDEFVGTFIKKYSDNLDFSYSGPWPPYNFTSIVSK